MGWECCDVNTSGGVLVGRSHGDRVQLGHACALALCQYRLDDIPGNVGQPEVTTLKLEGQPRVVNP
jgi:hypothetical protein